MAKPIRDHPSFLDCILMVATEVAANKLHVGSEVPSGGFPKQAKQGSPGATAVRYYKNERKYQNFQYNWVTHKDDFFYNDRFMPLQCQKVGLYSKQISALSVEGNACCAFYSDDACKSKGLFSMSNREDMNLKGKDNDAIPSFYCTTTFSCEGNPGM